MASLQWLKSDKKRSNLLVNPPDDKKWYDSLTASTTVASSSSFNLKELNMIQDIALKEFQKEEDIYLKRRRKTGQTDVDEKWIRDVAQSGTLSDKIAALALIIQESPIHNLQAFDTLLNYCSNKKEQRSCQLAMDAVKDLLIHNILPDRKLNSFKFYCNSGRFHQGDMNVSILLTCWYEDQLISRIKKFIDNIEEIGLKSTNIEYFKKYCMEIVCDLLINKPEQEARLLNMLVNKLGDPMKGIVPKCIELLDKIMSIHSVMKGVIVREVRQFLHRPQLPPRSLYASINFLTSIHLTKKDMEALPSSSTSSAAPLDVASQLVECYISLFEKSTTIPSGESQSSSPTSSSKLLSSLLQGVNRVYPFLKNKQSLIKHIDTLFKITHTTHFATAVQALTLISHIALPSSSRNATNFHEVTSTHNAVTTDYDDSNTSSSNGIVTRYYRALYSMLFSEQVLSRTRNTLFFKLLYRSLKFDPSVDRKLAFMKRLSILLLQCNSSIAAGILLLLSEACSHLSVGKSRGPGNVAMMNIDAVSNKKLKDSNLSFFPLDSLFSFPTVTDTVLVDDHEHAWFDCYDALKREPLYALHTGHNVDPLSYESIDNGNNSNGSHNRSSKAGETVPTLWETALLMCHFHPSVKAFMNGFSAPSHKIDFTGDPISDFSITAFLNRFAYKNPKKKRETDTSSNKTKQHLSCDEEPINLVLDPTNSTGESSSALSTDKLFFYKYFTEREKLRSEGKVRNRSKKNKSSHADDEDLDENDEDAMDMFADKLADDMMKNHAKSINPDDDDSTQGDYESDDDLFQEQNESSDNNDDVDDGEEDDESDSDMDFDDFAKKHSNKRSNGKLSQVRDSNKGKKSAALLNDDDDSDDGYELANYDSDEDTSHQLSKTCMSKGSARKDVNSNKNKKRSKDTGSDDMSDFAEAEDYEEEIDELMQKRFGSTNRNENEGVTDPTINQLKVSKSKRRRQK